MKLTSSPGRFKRPSGSSSLCHATEPLSRIVPHSLLDIICRSNISFLPLINDCNKKKKNTHTVLGMDSFKQITLCHTAGYSSDVNAFRKISIYKKNENGTKKSFFVKKYIFMNKLFVKCMNLLCKFSMQCKIKKG